MRKISRRAVVLTACGVIAVAGIIGGIVATSSSTPGTCYAGIQEGSYGQYYLSWAPKPGHTCSGDTTTYSNALNEGELTQIFGLPMHALQICTGTTGVHVYADTEDSTAWGQSALC